MLGQNEWRLKKTGILIEKQGIAGIALVQSETSPKALAKYKDTIKAEMENLHDNYGAKELNPWSMRPSHSGTSQSRPCCFQ